MHERRQVTSEWLSDLAHKASLVVSSQRLKGIHRQVWN